MLRSPEVTLALAWFALRYARANYLRSADLAPSLVWFALRYTDPAQGKAQTNAQIKFAETS